MDDNWCYIQGRTLIKVGGVCVVGEGVGGTIFYIKKKKRKRRVAVLNIV